MDTGSGPVQMLTLSMTLMTQPRVPTMANSTESPVCCDNVCLFSDMTDMLSCFCQEPVHVMANSMEKDVNIKMTVTRTVIARMAESKSCHDMSCHMELCHNESCHMKLCHMKSCHMSSCNMGSCQMKSCHMKSCHMKSCHMKSCHLKSCHMKSYEITASTYNHDM